MAQGFRRAFYRRFASGALSVFAFFLVSFSLERALAANPDCPAKQAAFAVDGARPADVDPDGDKSLRILAIGSSSTEGIGASAPGLTYPAQLQTRLAARLGRKVEVDNAGVGGETVAATVVRLKAALKAGKPDLVIWQVGTNDAVVGEDEASFRKSLQDGVWAIRDAKVPFVLLDPQFFPGVRDIERYERYVRIIHDLGAQNGAAVFSRYALMKEWGAESDGLLRAMLAKDAFHMSDRGYGCLAQNLAADLAPLWRRRFSAATDRSAAVGPMVK